MEDPDQKYYGRRAEEEIRRANRADSVEARRCHSLLAGFYLDRLHSSDPAIVQMLADGVTQKAGAPLAQDQADAFVANRDMPSDAPRSRVVNMNLFRNG